ncbi:hypothetical protein DBR32_01830 [Taibaiella sp. KBW10]|uniref:hypothetical protein n=1 Tax=Taibaiella sp. KBW10 TaxID=2153357 RepID=UPI000F593D8B|nr:hypothetical protein [Taibaiella sp. KBW10]RQO32369.1 hypothetical protein DBR32_01830 [Taibaiella sp. KBW10]
MSEEKAGKFGGILGGLRKLIFTDEQIAKDEPKTPSEHITKKEEPTPATPITSNNLQTANLSNEEAVTESELIEKMYKLFDSLNKPGVDFFELWNAAEAMGGPTVQNIQNAYTTLKILGLSKESLLQSGNAYVTELDEKINTDIRSKQQEKTGLLAQQEQEKRQLSQQQADLQKQIEGLQQSLQQTNDKLALVDSKYSKPVAVIDHKIQVGQKALQMVTNKMKTVLQTIETSVQ